MDNYETGIYTDNPDDTLRYMQTTQPVDLCGYPKRDPDIVEVVRCRNCRWGHYDDLLNVYWCDGVAHTDDFFCANGRKKKPTQECVGERRSE